MADQLHGGSGSVEDSAIERLSRDARVTRPDEGTSGGLGAGQGLEPPDFTAGFLVAPRGTVWYAAAALTKPDPEGLSPFARSLRTAGPWLNATWQFIGSVLVGALMGYGVDRWLGSSPVGIIVGLVVGISTGMYALISASIRLSKVKKQ